MPVNAAEASAIACALASRIYCAKVVILVTATGQSAVQFSKLSPDTIVIAVTKDAFVARKLRLYRGIYPVIYDGRYFLLFLLFLRDS